MIDFGMLERLLEMLHQSDAHTIEVRKGFWNTTIRVSKGGIAAPGQPVTYQVSGGNTAPPAAAPSTPPASAHRDAGDATEAGARLSDITSPMVGTFYAQPEPGADPYVRVGARVNPGDTLCIIEAMKIMNPLDSEVSGVIKEVLVEDAQPVEFGQVLFRVDANA